MKSVLTSEQKTEVNRQKAEVKRQKAEINRQNAAERRMEHNVDKKFREILYSIINITEVPKIRRQLLEVLGPSTLTGDDIREIGTMVINYLEMYYQQRFERENRARLEQPIEQFSPQFNQFSNLNIYSNAGSNLSSTWSYQEIQVNPQTPQYNPYSNLPSNWSYQENQSYSPTFQLQQNFPKREDSGHFSSSSSSNRQVYVNSNQVDRLSTSFSNIPERQDSCQFSYSSNSQAPISSNQPDRSSTPSDDFSDFFDQIFYAPTPSEIKPNIDETQRQLEIELQPNVSFVDSTTPQAVHFDPGEPSTSKLSILNNKFRDQMPDEYNELKIIDPDPKVDKSKRKASRSLGTAASDTIINLGRKFFRPTKNDKSKKS